MARERERERDLLPHMRFIDPRKVYNSVDHTLPCNVLVRYGAPVRMIPIISQFHGGTRAYGCHDSCEIPRSLI